MKYSETILYKISSFLIPIIFLIFLYNQNIAQNSLLFSHLLIFSALFGITSIIISLLSNLIIKNKTFTIIFNTAFWTFFFNYYNFQIANIFDFALIILMAFVAIYIIFLILKKKISKIKQINNYTYFFIAILFFINLFSIPNLFQRIQIHRINSDFEFTKTQFVVDSSLPNPNIYWLWVDGMLNFDAVYYFFQDSQDEFYSQLQERGFVVNKTSKSPGPNTYNSVIGLFSPQIYDNLLGPLLLDVVAQPGEMQHMGGALVNELMNRHGLYHQDLFDYNEFFLALKYAGYTMIQHTPSIGPWNTHPLTHFDYFYRPRDYDTLTILQNYNITNTNIQFINLLTQATPLYIIQNQIDRIFTPADIITHDQMNTEDIIVDENRINYILNLNNNNGIIERYFYRNLLHSMDSAEPRFVLSIFDDTHAMQMHNNTEGAIINNIFYLDAYINSHRILSNIIINFIDIIKERDPDAVIILQADHGIHIYRARQYMMEYISFTPESYNLAIYSALSAVLIPEKFGGLEFPLDPRNISREIINRFVGQNYNLIE